jgi:hypothetical protein
MFLGMKTRALPLALWILMSVGAGAFTSLLITGLFKLSTLFARSLPRERRNVGGSSSTQPKEAHHTAASTSKSDTDSTSTDAVDDWNSNSTDDWNWEEDTDKTRDFNSQKDVRDSRTYEASTEPKSGFRSGSVYSYSYRDPSNSGVGKTESVYDADYRVITPPYQQKNTDGEDKDEDWGFELDEDDKK